MVWNEIGVDGAGGDIAGENHATLSNLDYASSGHTGFVPSVRNLSTTAPLTGGGDLSADRTLGIIQATALTDGYLTAAQWVIFNLKMSNPMDSLGDIIYGGAAGAPTKLAAGAAGTVLHGGSAPSWSKVVESDIQLAVNTTNDVSSTKHGFAPKLPGDPDQYLNGQGNWVTPASIANAYTTQSFTNQTSVTVTHGFGAYPLVQVIDGTGAVLIPKGIVHNSDDDVTITFDVATSGNIVLTLGSPQAQNLVSISANYTILSTNRIIKATSPGITIKVLTAVGNSSREFVIDNASGGNITLAPDIGGQTIEDETSQTIPPNSAIHIYSDNVNWRIF
jgi:hypothetical protein